MSPKIIQDADQKKNEDTKITKTESIDFDSTVNTSIKQNIDLDQESVKIVNLPPKSMADLLNKTNDFQNATSCQISTPSVAYLYGLCRFLVISPTVNSIFIDTESRANVILSSISIAINNTGW